MPKKPQRSKRGRNLLLFSSHLPPVRLCAEPECTNPARNQRRWCNTCRARRWNERHPISLLWKNLHSSATKRRIKFTLTLDEFTDFYNSTIDDPLWGHTVDRIKRRLGYSAGNLQWKTVGDNSRKYHREERHEPPDIPVADDGSEQPF
jgi:hypothetical protein